MQKYERNDAEFLRVVAPLAYGFADKTFKFVSWLILIAAIRFAQTTTQSDVLWWLSFFLTTIYAWTLFFVLTEMSMRGFPESPYVPSFLRWIIAAALFLFGFGMAIFIMLPSGDGSNIIDQLIIELQRTAK